MLLGWHFPPLNVLKIVQVTTVKEENLREMVMTLRHLWLFVKMLSEETPCHFQTSVTDFRDFSTVGFDGFKTTSFD